MPRPQPFRPSPLAAALALVFVSCSSAAQAADGEQTLNTVTVSGGNTPLAVSASPNASQAQVTAAQIAQMNVVSTEDTLRYVPGLNVRQRYTGDRNAVISARTTVGSTPSASSLVYADGLLLANLLGNSYSYPPRWNMIAASEIESMDVLYGPFSALLPGNSAGATVFITTRRPEATELHVDALRTQQKFALYGTNSTYNTHQEQMSGAFRVGNLRVSLMANHLNAYGQPMSYATGAASTGSGSTAVSGFSRDAGTLNEGRWVWGGYGIDHSIQNTAKIRLDYDFSARTRASLTYAEFRNDSDSSAESYLRNADGSTYWGTVAGQRISTGTNQYVTVKAADFGHSMSATTNRLWGLGLNTQPSDELRIELVGSHYSTPQDTNRAATNGMLQGDSGAGTITYGDGTGWQNADLRAIWRGLTGHTLTGGYHVDQYSYSSLKYDTSAWRSDTTTRLSTQAEGKTRTDALYLQDAWKLAPAWTFTSGLRHEYWQTFEGYYYDRSLSSASKRFDDRDGHYTSPKATLAWQAHPDWLLKASLARAYRMPTVTELYATATSATGQKYIADADLKPEKILAAELAAEGAVGGGLLRVSLFQENKQDYILSQRNSITGITALSNVDKTRVQGAEVAWSGNDVGLRGLDLQGSITYAESEVVKDAARPEYEGRPLAIPRWRLAGFASYRASDAWSASLGARYSSRYTDLNPAFANYDLYGASSGFWVADARLSYRFAPKASASIGMNNIGAEKYYAYHPYPQRTLFAQVKWDY